MKEGEGKEGGKEGVSHRGLGPGRGESWGSWPRKG